MMALCALAALAVSAAPGPASADAAVGEAVKRYLRADLPGALAAVRRVLRADPSNARARALAELVGAAIERGAGRTASKDPRLSEGLLRDGVAAYLRGEDDRAQESLRTAARLDPRGGPVRRALRLLARRGSGEPKTLREKLEALVPPGKSALPVTAEFRNESIENVLALFADVYGVNVVAGDDLRGTVSLSLREVPLIDAFESILKASRCGLVEEGGVYRLVREDPNEIVMRVIRLRHVSLVREEAVSTGDEEDSGGGDGTFSSSETDTGGTEDTGEGTEGEDRLAVCRSLLSEQGTLEYDPLARLLVVRDTADRVEAIERFVEEIDRPRKQVLISAYLVETEVGNTRNVGINWDLDYDLGLTSAARPTTFPFPRQHDPIYEFRPDKDPTDDGFPSSSVDGGRNIFPYVSTEDFAFGTLSGGDLGVALTLLETEGYTDVLSAPRVAAVDGETAEIQVGDRIPIPQYTTDSETGNVTVAGFSEERVGILLQVIPYVYEDETILLTVHPEVSAVTGWVGPNQDRPVVATRESTTWVRLRDGGTFVIGGLMSLTEIATTRRVPYLSRIPLLGELFTSRSRERTKNELLVFLKVRIVPVGQEPAEDEQDKLRDVLKKWKD